jgi:hypothetical protein
MKVINLSAGDFSLSIKINKSTWFLFNFVLLVISFFATAVFADARSNYLINMLEKGGSYRVKVQAAGSLGRIKCKDAVPALKKALHDSNELVVIAAATALGQIGDVSAIGDLTEVSGRTKSMAARSQILTTLRILKSIASKSQQSSFHGSSRVLFLARVDVMGNSSDYKSSDIISVMGRILKESLLANGHVRIQEDGLTDSQVVKEMKTQGLRGFIISGSLLKLKKVQNFIEVKVALNVFSNPDYNLLMMPSGGIRYPLKSENLSSKEEKAAYEDAIRRLIDDLLGKVLTALPTVLK